jgi:hypothetical protein
VLRTELEYAIDFLGQQSPIVNLSSSFCAALMNAPGSKPVHLLSDMCVIIIQVCQDGAATTVGLVVGIGAAQQCTR